MGEEDRKCPKCGGEMIPGAMRFDQETIRPNTNNPYMSGFSHSPIPQVVEEYTGSPYWEERTGRKTGFLFKREEKLNFRISGYRCKLCGYLELYATEEV